MSFQPKKRGALPAPENDVYDQFLRFLIDLGFDPNVSIIGDGNMHRVWVHGKNGKRKKDGVYTLHMDGIPAGWAQCHASGGEVHKWRYNGNIGATREELSEWKRKAAERAKQRRLAQERLHAEKSNTAMRIWTNSSPANEHPYLTRKGVAAHRIKMREYRGKSLLVIPLYSLSITDGALKYSLQTLEFIGEDGDKRFLKGGKKAGGMHILSKIEPNSYILIAEGYSTAASIHEATGYPSVMCADCGNMLAVSRTIRECYPDNPIVICADDDHMVIDANGRKINPGVSHASSAADNIGAKLAVPMWNNIRKASSKDFNDLAADEGLEAVSMIIKNAMTS